MTQATSKPDRVAGSVGILFALSIIPVLLAAGAAIDFAAAHWARTRLQAAADVAVLTGAAAIDAAAGHKERLARDSFAAQLSLNPAVAQLNPDLSFVIRDRAVSLTAKARIATSFMKIVGIEATEVTVVATANGRRGKPVCMLALDEDTTDSIMLIGDSRLTAERCAVHSNSRRNDPIKVQGAAQSVAESFCAVGQFSRPGAALGLRPSPEGRCASIDDPLTKLPPPPALDCTARGTELRKGSHALSPGVYCGGLVAMTHASVKLSPGLYVIKDGPLVVQAQAALTGSEVTIYFVGRDTRIDIQGGASVDLSAPRSGTYRGLVIVQQRDSNPGAVSVITGGGGIAFEGTLYMPTQVVGLQGNGAIGNLSNAWSLVASRFEMSGTPDIRIGSDFRWAGYGDALVYSAGAVVLTE